MAATAAPGVSLQEPAPGVDLQELKARQQATWSLGDYSMVATPLVVVSETLCEAVDLRAGQRVLDVATGSGNTAIAAARRHCDVTGIDYVPALLERGRERASAERLPIAFQEGDTESIPFEDAAFDVVLSTFGAMFAPNQEQAARELLRVCKPGGRIGMANWTPEGLAGRMFRVVGGYLPPSGAPPPSVWGTEEGLRRLLGGGISDLSVARRGFVFRYRSSEHWLDTFRTYFGPVRRVFQALEAEKQDALARDLTGLIEECNQSGDSTIVAPSEYLEVVATRAG